MNLLSIRFAAAIARATKQHGAPTIDEEVQVVSLRAFNALMRFKAIQHNDSPITGKGGRAIEGWEETWYQPNPRMPNKKRKFRLEYQTMSARLRTELTETEVLLEFYMATPGINDDAASVRFVARPDDTVSCLVRYARPEILDKYPDVIQLLLDINLELAGEIYDMVRAEANKPTPASNNAEVLLKAWNELLTRQAATRPLSQGDNWTSPPLGSGRSH